MTTMMNENSPAKAILTGGLLAGVLDISQAFLAWGFMGISPYRILQNVAAGALGKASFQMGLRSAALGLLFHFFIAFTAATVFWLASRALPALVDRPVVYGLLYGELVYVFMNFVVVPLSALRHFPVFSTAHIVTGPIGHPFLVGLPIALTARAFNRTSNAS
jgi:hypothetical protein